MNLNDNQKKILAAAIEQWGPRQQIIKAVEELGELSQALCKWLNIDVDVKNGNLDGVKVLNGVHEEMADVTLMLGQLKMIFGDKIQFYADAKIRRLRTYLPTDPCIQQATNKGNKND